MSYSQKKLSVLVAILASAIMVTSCYNYYKTMQPNTNSTPRVAKVVDSLQTVRRYFVLRSGSYAYYMSNLSLSDDKTVLKTTLDSLPPDHQLHLRRGHRNGNLQYKKGTSESWVLDEVHLYIKDDALAKPGSYTLSLDKVQKIEVIEKDKGRTTGSYVIGALGFTLGSLVVAAIIVAATKSSCPFVSAYDGEQFLLQGEIYGGAIYPQLARDDYMPLLMRPAANGNLELKISNELQERQYTDVADLMVITHKKNMQVLSDEKGNLFPVSELHAPVKATFSDQKDVLAPLQTENDNRLLYFDDTLADNARNYTDIQFDKPASAAKAKLVLSVKNSYWLDYLYGELIKGIGTYYPTYLKEQAKRPASDLIKWSKEQHMPLEVSVKTSTGWQKITDITTIGPVATRKLVIPVNLADAVGPYAEIRLSSGFMFWEIDYAAIDYSEDRDFTIETISPSTAIDETGKDVLASLTKADGVYLEQPVPGNVVTLQYKYKAATDPGSSYSYILHTRGYYTHVRDFKTPPDINFLSQFKKPDAFPAFSLSLYKKFRNTNLQSLAMH
jgi:hypothetical protein